MSGTCCQRTVQSMELKTWVIKLSHPKIISFYQLCLLKRGSLGDTACYDPITITISEIATKIHNPSRLLNSEAPEDT